jgi:hypothetical protein
MKKVLCVLAVLAVVAVVNANVRIIVTKSSEVYGLNETQNHNIATFSTVDADGVNTNAYDFYYSYLGAGTTGDPSTCNGFSVSAGKFPGISAPQGSIANPIEIQLDEFGYIWFMFDNEANGSKIKGLKITINDVTVPGVAPEAGLGATYYYQNDKQNLSSQYRWDGQVDQPGQPQFHHNPQTLVGVTSPAISADRLDSPWNMYDYISKSGTGTTGVYLLGAIDPDVAYRTGHTYEIGIMSGLDIEYASGLPGTLVHGYFKLVPEPASLLLLGLAGLVLRRR